MGLPKNVRRADLKKWCRKLYAADGADSPDGEVGTLAMYLVLFLGIAIYVWQYNRAPSPIEPTHQRTRARPSENGVIGGRTDGDIREARLRRFAKKDDGYSG